MTDMFTSALSVATAVLAALERRMHLPEGYFERKLGPIAEHSQWHVKRYRPDARSEHAGAAGADGVDKRVLLAVHTDPSLISVVLHDAPGAGAGAVGLEYLSGGRAGAGAGQWMEVPLHGGELTRRGQSRV
jgi:hypothetical protein